MENIKKKLIIFATVLLIFSGLVRSASAEGDQSFSMSGNGSSSDNEISVSSSNDSTVDQTNNAEVSNTVSIDANTGGNTASDNTNGNTSIDTGTIEVKTTINNDVNTSVLNTVCCPINSGSTGGHAAISGNGSYSNNNISYNNSSGYNVTVNNDAYIANTIYGYANTGNNVANDNTGEVTITTGDISIREKIINRANNAYVSLGLPLDYNMMLKITGNGTGSANEIELDEDNEIVVAISNTADIFNENFWDLVTGDNTANDNTGDVAINTGDISIEKQITNDVNKSVVVIECCEKEKEKAKPLAVTPEKPVIPKPGDDKPGQGGPGQPKGDVLGTAMGKVLPETGFNWFAFALVGNIAMLLLGTVLRLRSGRSPGYETL